MRLNESLDGDRCRKITLPQGSLGCTEFTQRSCSLQLCLLVGFVSVVVHDHSEPLAFSNGTGLSFK